MYLYYIYSLYISLYLSIYYCKYVDPFEPKGSNGDDSAEGAHGQPPDLVLLL